jgi:hypothetical protein
MDWLGAPDQGAGSNPLRPLGRNGDEIELTTQCFHTQIRSDDATSLLICCHFAVKAIDATFSFYSIDLLIINLSFLPPRLALYI